VILAKLFDPFERSNSSAGVDGNILGITVSSPFVPIKGNTKEQFLGWNKGANFGQIGENIMFEKFAAAAQGSVGSGLIILREGVVISHENKIIGERGKGGEIPDSRTRSGARVERDGKKHIGSGSF